MSTTIAKVLILLHALIYPGHNWYVKLAVTLDSTDPTLWICGDALMQVSCKIIVLFIKRFVEAKGQKVRYRKMGDKVFSRKTTV